MSLRTRTASVLSAAFGAETRGNPLENPDTPLSAGGIGSWLYDLFAGEPSAAGVAVNEHTSMQQATVFTCVSTLTRDIATLRMVVYEIDGKTGYPPSDRTCTTSSRSSRTLKCPLLRFGVAGTALQS